MKVGLLFGSFNPIHNGHLAIAECLLDLEKWDEVWLVLSPQNPFKINSDLLETEKRLKMVEAALESKKNIRVCKVELSMPIPSYTIDTMNVLEKQFPEHQFYIIIGSDNLKGLSKWKEIESLLSKYPFHVYSRNADTDNEILHPNIHFHTLPLQKISSTEIREKIKNKKSIKKWVHPAVDKLIKEHAWYKQ